MKSPYTCDLEPDGNGGFYCPLCGMRADYMVTCVCPKKQPEAPRQRFDAEIKFILDTHCNPCVFNEDGNCKLQCKHNRDLLEGLKSPSYVCPIYKWTNGKKRTRKLVLHSPQSPGDLLTLTAAIYSLHEHYPNLFVTDVRTPTPAIWENNPHITHIEDNDPDARWIHMEYPSIHESNQRSYTFLEGYTRYLSDVLQVPIPLMTNRPHLYLSDEEKGWINQVEEAGHKGPFWLLNAGVKQDFPLKQWPHYQELVDSTDKTWVQVGSAEHNHPKLNGVIDLVGKTTHRQLIRLAYHASGGVGPVTYLQHLMAAWEKPYVCLLGGREPVPWVGGYPRQHTLHTIGTMPCCETGACWKSKDCDNSVDGIGECMRRITAGEVSAILERI